MQKFWAIENIGITDNPNLSDDDTAVIHFNKTVEFIDNRYHIRWPFKSETPDLPNNFGLSIGRLRSLIKRLKKDNLLIAYDKVLQEQMDLNVNEVTNYKSDLLTHYLPHQLLIRENSNTTK